MKLVSRIFLCITLITTSSTILSFNFPPKFLPPASAQTPTHRKQESLGVESIDAKKVSIFETQARTYQNLQRALIAQNQLEAALEVSERGRTRAFVKLWTSRGNSTPLVAINPPTSKQIREIAQKQNATLVQYSIISDADKESELYIWVIQPNGEVAFRSFNLKSRNTSLKDLVISSRKSLSVRHGGGMEVKPTKEVQRLKSNFDVAPLAEVNSTIALQQLHQILIQPIADLLPTNPSAPVVFIPQGELFLVPFAALQDANKNYLIEKHTILTAPSIQVLNLTQRQKQRLAGVTKDVLVVGNPASAKIPSVLGQPQKQLPGLLGAEKEAINIAQLLNTQPLIGVAATETAIAQKLPQARIIHLATYAFQEDFTGRGVPGVIVLTSSGKDDGLLSAGEIQKLQLNAELVVLSGGNTALGKITGDGVIGLPRAFMAAGVPNVIGSLWCVPDQPTAKLMTEFYRQLSATGDAAAALRQAMLQTMKENPNPKDWAAFTLIGTAK